MRAHDARTRQNLKYRNVQLWKFTRDRTYVCVCVCVCVCTWPSTVPGRARPNNCQKEQSAVAAGRRAALGIPTQLVYGGGLIVARIPRGTFNRRQLFRDRRVENDKDFVSSFAALQLRG